MENPQNPQEYIEPVLIGDVLPGVIEGIRQRQDARALLLSQQELFGATDHQAQEELGTVQAKLQDLSEKIQKRTE